MENITNGDLVLLDTEEVKGQGEALTKKLLKSMVHMHRNVEFQYLLKVTNTHFYLDICYS